MIKCFCQIDLKNTKIDGRTLLKIFVMLKVFNLRISKQYDYGYYKIIIIIL